MLKRIQNFENNFSITKAASIVGVFTLFAKLVALVRDAILAGKFGPGILLDTYYAAFRIPDFIFNLLILGTLSVAFIPVFTELMTKDREKAYRIANSVLNVTALAMVVISGLLFLLARPLTELIAPGFRGAELLSAVKLTRLFLLSPIIFTLSNVFSSILNSQKKFLVVSLAPILYNLGIIVGVFLFYPHFGLMGLGFGVIFGACLHLLIQVPEAVRLGYRWQWVLDLREPVMRKIGKLFLPRIIGMDNSQISLLIGTSVGSILAAGSVTIFNFANNLQAVPLGIFAVSLATAAFPALAESFALKDERGFTQLLYETFGKILFFIIPISALMILFREPIVRITLGHGKFSYDDTVLTFTTLGIFSISLFSQALTPLLSKAFYARHNTIIPVLVNVSTIALNAVLAFVWGKAYGVIGIAAGFSLASVLNTALLFGLLYLRLDAELVKEFNTSLLKQVGKILLASAGMSIAAYFSIKILGSLLKANTTIEILIQSGLAVGISLLGFLLFGSWLKLPQIEIVSKAIKRLKNRTAHKVVDKTAGL